MGDKRRIHENLIYPSKQSIPYTKLNIQSLVIREKAVNDCSLLAYTI
jgi:hypothetical protein